MILQLQCTTNTSITLTIISVILTITHTSSSKSDLKQRQSWFQHLSQQQPLTVRLLFITTIILLLSYLLKQRNICITCIIMWIEIVNNFFYHSIRKLKTTRFPAQQLYQFRKTQRKPKHLIKKMTRSPTAKRDWKRKLAKMQAYRAKIVTQISHNKVRILKWYRPKLPTWWPRHQPMGSTSCWTKLSVRYGRWKGDKIQNYIGREEHQKPLILMETFVKILAMENYHLYQVQKNNSKRMVPYMFFFLKKKTSPI